MYTKQEINAIHVHGTKDTKSGDKENLNEQFSTRAANSSQFLLELLLYCISTGTELI